MTPEELIEILAERPFVPLLLHMSNGRTHEVRHPENILVGEEVVAISIPKKGRVYPLIRMVSLPHINEIEPVSSVGG